VAVRWAGLSADEVERRLEEESGLLGLSGSSGDMRALLDAADSGDDRAQLATEVYLHRLRAGVAAMTASLGGLDAVLFTGGVGENSARIRWECCEGLGFLGLAIDREANEAASGDRDLTAEGAEARVLVVQTREDLEIARETRRLIDGRPN
jgi:acetate kinase